MLASGCAIPEWTWPAHHHLEVMTPAECARVHPQPSATGFVTPFGADLWRQCRKEALIFVGPSQRLCDWHRANKPPRRIAHIDRVEEFGAAPVPFAQRILSGPGAAADSTPIRAHPSGRIRGNTIERWPNDIGNNEPILGVRPRVRHGKKLGATTIRHRVLSLACQLQQPLDLRHEIANGATARANE